jgi:phytanoyl-CoA hydroxylase
MPSLSPQQWQQFHEQGYLSLGKAIDDALLATLQQRLDDLALGKIPFGGKVERIANSTNQDLPYSTIRDLERDPLFLALIEMPVYREICVHEYGSDTPIACFGAMCMEKTEGRGALLPWHQDGGAGWGLDRDPLVTCWAAFDDATSANGCLQIIPGSHKLGLLTKGDALSKDQVSQYCGADSIEFLEMKAGEVVLLHNWLVHRSDVNKTKSRRRGFSVCYMDASTRRLADGVGFPTLFEG